MKTIRVVFVTSSPYFPMCVVQIKTICISLMLMICLSVSLSLCICLCFVLYVFFYQILSSNLFSFESIYIDNFHIHFIFIFRWSRNEYVPATNGSNESRNDTYRWHWNWSETTGELFDLSITGKFIWLSLLVVSIFHEVDRVELVQRQPNRDAKKLTRAGSHVVL